MRLHRVDLRDGVEDRALDLVRHLVGLLERQLTGKLQVQRHLGVTADVQDADVVHLAHRGNSERRRMRAVADRRLVLLRLDVDDDVAPRQSGVERILHASAAAWPCPTAAPGGTVITTSMNWRGPACRIRSRRASQRARPPRSPGAPPALRPPVRDPSGRPIALHQPRGRKQDENRHEEGGDGVRARVALRARARARPAPRRSGEIAGKMERVRRERCASVAARRAPRERPCD